MKHKYFLIFVLGLVFSSQNVVGQSFGDYLRINVSANGSNTKFISQASFPFSSSTSNTYDGLGYQVDLSFRSSEFLMAGFLYTHWSGKRNDPADFKVNAAMVSLAFSIPIIYDKFRLVPLVAGGPQRVDYGATSSNSEYFVFLQVRYKVSLEWLMIPQLGFVAGYQYSHKPTFNKSSYSTRIASNELFVGLAYYINQRKIN